MSEHIAISTMVHERSIERWGNGRPTTIVGNHPTLASVLAQTARFARSDSPVLITGETGTGKELFARAIYLLSPRSKGQFLSINCAQYQEGQIIASELFGHKRGSFTGAVSDHRGIFEATQEGVVFLDEVGELSASAQAMLLRLLSEGEIVPVGESRARRVNVRTVMATNRDLRTMVHERCFRADLYYRLRQLQLHIPPVRERGDDWRAILEHYLERMVQPGSPSKSFSPQALELLSRHDWPGNVREIRAIVDTGFHLSDGTMIDAQDFAQSLEEAASLHQTAPLRVSRVSASAAASPTVAPSTERSIFDCLVSGEGTFWQLVQEPYLERELNRQQVRDIIARGLRHSGGQYKRLLGAFGIASTDYLKFMDFLRHHRLKPPSGYSA